jgi:hypothetical protein
MHGRVFTWAVKVESSPQHHQSTSIHNIYLKLKQEDDIGNFNLSTKRAQENERNSIVNFHVHLIHKGSGICQTDTR